LTADIQGIHHVTAIASNPQRNIDFYTKILELLPKVNTLSLSETTTKIITTEEEQGIKEKQK
jgi:glyoxalase family protein